MVLMNLPERRHSDMGSKKMRVGTVATRSWHQRTRRLWNWSTL